MKCKTRSTGVYVYGLTRSTVELDRGAIGITDGGRPANVYRLTEGPLAAVVSARSRGGSVMPSRRDLDAHQRVTSRALERGTILPFTFGQVAESEEAVRRLLRDHQGQILKELDRLDGKLQMGLKVEWDVPNIYQYILDADPDLAGLCEEVCRSGHASMAEKIEMGERFDDARQARRHADVEAITRSLSHLAAPPQEILVLGEKSVADLMFLIERVDQARFSDAVESLAATWPNEYVFRPTGPWPPFNFVELELFHDAAAAGAGS